MSFDELQNIQNQTEYKEGLKDRYVGQIDPVTKLRQGQGTYTYPNSLYQYQGFYKDGRKHTEPGQAATFVMRDGTKFTGNFQNGEITGQGLKRGSDGRVYQGDFVEGEMHGNGLLMYNVESKTETDRAYEGQFHFNSREGNGVLTKINGDVYTGTFQNNMATGPHHVEFGNGDVYDGEIFREVIKGEGVLSTADSKTFKGTFDDG